VLLAGTTLIAFSAPMMAQGGRLDATFGSGGKVLTSVPGAINAMANAITLQNDGKIIVAGELGVSADIGLVRYNTNGTLDTGFGSSGIAQANILNGVLSSAIGVRVLPTTGEILAGGTIYTLLNPGAFIGLGVVRFNPNGSTDTTFGTAGIVQTLAFGASECGGTAFALQPDGKILLAGGCTKGTSPNLISFSTIARYTANGSLDTTFGTGGTAVLAEAPAAITLQSDGKILVAGGGTVSRYNTNGSIDSSFGIFGSLGALGSVAAIALQGDGKIVVAGTFSDQLTVPADGDFALTRYNSDGTVDETFGTHGRARADFFSGSSSAIASALAIDSKGNLVVAGKAAEGSNPSEFAVARLTSLGVLDITFGAGGVVTTSFGEADSVAALAIQPDGKIVGVGNSFNAGANTDSFALARYTAE
jgi:uncharacterized delta-60 repeat protein